MHISKLKVRPRKNPPVNLCTTELTAMLGCWAATGDHMSVEPCANHATALFACMRTVPGKKKTSLPTINYHLARLNKTIR